MSTSVPVGFQQHVSGILGAGPTSLVIPQVGGSTLTVTFPGAIEVDIDAIQIEDSPPIYATWAGVTAYAYEDGDAPSIERYGIDGVLVDRQSTAFLPADNRTFANFHARSSGIVKIDGKWQFAAPKPINRVVLSNGRFVSLVVA